MEIPELNKIDSVYKVYKIIMRDFRCPTCNKLLFKGKIRGQYHIETRCLKCGKDITIDNNSIVAKERNEKNEN